MFSIWFWLCILIFQLFFASSMGMNCLEGATGTEFMWENNKQYKNTTIATKCSPGIQFCYKMICTQSILFHGNITGCNACDSRTTNRACKCFDCAGDLCNKDLPVSVPAKSHAQRVSTAFSRQSILLLIAFLTFAFSIHSIILRMLILITFLHILSQNSPGFVDAHTRMAAAINDAKSDYDSVLVLLDEIPWGQSQIGLDVKNTPPMLNPEAATTSAFGDQRSERNFGMASSIDSTLTVGGESILKQISVSDNVGDQLSGRLSLRSALKRSSQNSSAYSEQNGATTFLIGGQGKEFEDSPAYVIKSGSTALIKCKLNNNCVEGTKIEPTLRDLRHAFVSFVNIFQYEKCPLNITHLGSGQFRLIKANSSLFAEKLANPDEFYVVELGQNEYKIEWANNENALKYSIKLPTTKISENIQNETIDQFGYFLIWADTKKPTDGTGKFKIGVILVLDWEEEYSGNLAMCHAGQNCDKHSGKWFPGQNEQILAMGGKFERHIQVFAEILEIYDVRPEDGQLYSVKIDGELFPVAYLIIEYLGEGMMAEEMFASTPSGQTVLLAEPNAPPQFLTATQTHFVLQGETAFISVSMNRANLNGIWSKDSQQLDGQNVEKMKDGCPWIWLESKTNGLRRVILNEVQFSNQGYYYAQIGDKFTNVQQIMERYQFLGLACEHQQNDLSSQKLHSNTTATDGKTNPEAQMKINTLKECIHRSVIKFGDGKPDCSSEGSDKLCSFGYVNFTPIKNCLKQNSEKCDSYSHSYSIFMGGVKCSNCNNGAFQFHCPGEPSCAKCDGNMNCLDISDEENCTCEEIVSYSSKIFIYSASALCFTLEKVCRPYCQCPNATKMDKLFHGKYFG